MTLIQRDGTRFGVRENEAHPRITRKSELGHDRLEVVTVGAKAVQPDDGGVHRPVGIGSAGRHDHSFEVGFTHRLLRSAVDSTKN